MQGKIIKGVGGFYTVHNGIGTAAVCRARGVFRDRGEKPLVGDNVEFVLTGEADGSGRIEKLLPRKNELIRPAVANMDQALILVSAGKPAFHPLLLDNFLLWMGMQDVPVVIGIGKCDTDPEEAKIIADTYGGACRHGGGAFSGKDPTKVDRSGAYMARKIAKDILRYGLAGRCEVQLAYAIGVEEPVSISVETFKTSKVPNSYLVRWIREHYDLTPNGIIDTLHLLVHGIEEARQIVH